MSSRRMRCTGSQPLLQNTLAYSACVRHKGVLQKQQVEFRAVPKRASRLIRGGDPPLQEGNKAHMMQKHKPPPEMSVAKRKIYIPMSVWTEALAGHYNHGDSRLQKGWEQKRLRWQCSPFDLTLASCRAI